MSCAERTRTLALLDGALGGDATHERLRHVRVCAECKDTLKEHAASASRTSSRDDFDGIESEVVPSRPVRGLTSLFLPSFARGGAKRPRFMWMILVFCVVMIVFSNRKSPTTTTPEQQARALIATGTPVCVAPEGAFEARPRVITGLVPAGVASFRVVVVDESGRVAQEIVCQNGEAGCVIDECSLAGDGGPLRASRVMVPFPSPEALPLVAGRPYGVALALPGGHLGASVIFRSGVPPDPK